MKRFVLASLIALAASQAAGCIIESGDDDGGPVCPAESGNITANWEIKSAVTNANLGCPSGYNTAALYSQPVNADGTTVGDPIIDLFDCACGTGTTVLDPGLYLEWVEIATDNNSSVYAKSLSAFVDLSTGSKSFNAQILDDGGYFQLQWGLVDSATSAPLTCAQAGADGVESIGALMSDPNQANSDIFNCEDGYGITAGFAEGTYTVSVHALNAADQQLGDSVVLDNKVIQGPNKVTDLGTVMVPVD